jgi:large subunit ribosomal protein L32
MRQVAPTYSRCDHCGQAKLPHVVCQNCGWYKGRQVIEVE